MPTKKATTAAQSDADAHAPATPETSTGEQSTTEPPIAIGKEVMAFQAPPMIYGKMIELYGAVNAIAKTDRNTQQGFNFRGIDAVYNALHPKFAEIGVLPMPRVLWKEFGEFTNHKGTKFVHARIELEVKFYAADGSNVTASAVGEGMDMADKGTSKAMSMAMKYAMFTTLTIPTHDEDADATSPAVIGRGDAPESGDSSKGDRIPARSKRSNVQRSKPTKPQDDAWTTQEALGTTPEADAAREVRDNASAPEKPSQSHTGVEAIGKMSPDDLTEKLVELSMDENGLKACREYHSMITQAVKANLISPENAKEMLGYVKLRGSQIREAVEKA